MTSKTSDEQLKAIVIYDAPSDPHDIAEILTVVAGLSPTDALIHARSAPGVLPDRLSASQSELLIRRLATIGISADAIAPADLIDFRTPEIVHQARFEAEGLVFATDHGGGLLPWQQIKVISAGQVPLETTTRLVQSDDPMFAAGRRTHPGAHRTALPPTMELWLISDQRPLRIDQTRLNYDALEETKTDSSTENFRRFLIRLKELATTANLTPATIAYLRNDSALKYMFRSTNELERVTQFETLLAQRK